MKRKISEEKLSALSVLTGIDAPSLKKLYRLGLINVTGCLKLLIRNEYQACIQSKTGRKGQVIKCLSEKYNISASLVEHFIYNKNANTKAKCSGCGSIISKYISKKNQGKCDNCKST